MLNLKELEMTMLIRTNGHSRKINWRLLKKIEAGETIAQIAKWLNMPTATFWRYVDKYLELDQIRKPAASQKR